MTTLHDSAGILKPTVGLMFSGGVDSSVLLSELLAAGEIVQPFYITTGTIWQSEEQAAIQKYLTAVARPELLSLIEFEIPLLDLYGPDHWCLTGEKVPGRRTPDEAVFLPGRNLLLLMKPMLWCQANYLTRLLLGTLMANPFGDATSSFFEELSRTFATSDSPKINIETPLSHLTKKQVVTLGKRLPLQLTFSCLNPQAGKHCGDCNKCVEREIALQA